MFTSLAFAALISMYPLPAGEAPVAQGEEEFELVPGPEPIVYGCRLHLLDRPDDATGEPMELVLSPVHDGGVSAAPVYVADLPSQGNLPCEGDGFRVLGGTVGTLTIAPAPLPVPPLTVTRSSLLFPFEYEIDQLREPEPLPNPAVLEGACVCGLLRTDACLDRPVDERTEDSCLLAHGRLERAPGQACPDFQDAAHVEPAGLFYAFSEELDWHVAAPLTDPEIFRDGIRAECGMTYVVREALAGLPLLREKPRNAATSP